MKRLHNLEAEEVSLVPRGANKKKFIVLKSKDGDSMTKEDLLKAIAKTPDCMPKIEKILKEYKVKKADEDCEDEEVEKDSNTEGPLDSRAQEALKAVVRILTPFKDSLSPMLIHEVLSTAGLQTQRAEGKGETMTDAKTGSARQSPEKVKEEHKIEAMKAAKDAFQSHLAKLGYQKYPEEDMAQKDLEGTYGKPGKVVEDQGQGKEQEGTMNDPAGVEKTGVEKSFDLSALPKEAKPAMEAIFKMQKDLIKKNEELTSELSSFKRAARRKELIAKSATFTHLGGDVEERADLLEAAEAVSKEHYEKIVKSFESANEQVKKGSLFAEFGSSQSGKGAPSWEAIEQAAAGRVAKSGEKVTKAEAVDAFLRTAEGTQMYSEYIKEHPVNKGRA